jgi:hypothetical protein
MRTGQRPDPGGWPSERLRIATTSIRGGQAFGSVVCVSGTDRAEALAAAAWRCTPNRAAPCPV